MESFVEFKPSNAIRFPRLDTVLMVEKQLYKHRSDLTLTEIWHKLPRKVMWQSFLTIVQYLQYSGKILIEKDNTVTWIWNPRLLEYVKVNGLEI